MPRISGRLPQVAEVSEKAPQHFLEQIGEQIVDRLVWQVEKEIHDQGTDAARHGRDPQGNHGHSTGTHLRAHCGADSGHFRAAGLE